MSIDVELTGGVAVITINRPERMNAMDAEAYAALSEAWVRVRDDTAIRVAVVTGAGDRAFSTGADIKIVPDRPRRPARGSGSRSATSCSTAGWRCSSRSSPRSTATASAAA